MIDEVKRLLSPLLAKKMTPAQRRAFVAALREIADRHEHIAQADQAQQAKPGDRRLAPRAKGAGPGRAPSRFVRVEIVDDRGHDRLRLYVGRGLWYEIGSPERIDVQRLGAELRITAVEGDQGNALVVGKGMPRCFADGWRDILQLDAGRYSAKVQGGVIVVSERLDQ